MNWKVYLKNLNWGLIVALLFGVMIWVFVVWVVFSVCMGAGCSRITLETPDGFKLARESFLQDTDIGEVMYHHDPNGTTYFHGSSLKVKGVDGILEILR